MVHINIRIIMKWLAEYDEQKLISFRMSQLERQ